MMALAQVAGFVGILLLVAIFQVNDRKTMLRLQVASCIVWTLYYFLLGAYTGAGLILLGAVRTFLFAQYRQHEWVLPMMIAALGIATLITWENWTSMFAFCGMMMATIALWQKDPRMIRMLSLTVTPFWLTYNFLGGSYFGMAGDLITFASVLVGIWRFDLIPYIRRRKQQNMSTETIDTSLI